MCRKQETEADVIGIHLSARACFDPTAAVDVFTKLGEAEKSAGISTPGFLRTHPLSQVRNFFCLCNSKIYIGYIQDLESVVGLQI